MFEITRRWSYAPPAWRMFDALVDEREMWLIGDADSQMPGVIEAHRPDRVILAPWLDKDVDELVVTIEPSGAGSTLTVTARAGSALDAATHATIRHNLGVHFGAALRHWVDRGVTPE
jgi:hypothetical protein